MYRCCSRRRRGARPAPYAVVGGRRLAARACLSLLGTTLLNPTTALVFGSRSGETAGPLKQTVFVTAAFAASASRQVLLAGGGALLDRALTGHRGRLVASGVTTALAVHMAVAPR